MPWLAFACWPWPRLFQQPAQPRFARSCHSLSAAVQSSFRPGCLRPCTPPRLRCNARSRRPTPCCDRASSNLLQPRKCIARRSTDARFWCPAGKQACSVPHAQLIFGVSALDEPWQYLTIRVDVPLHRFACASHVPAVESRCNGRPAKCRPSDVVGKVIKSNALAARHGPHDARAHLCVHLGHAARKHRLAFRQSGGLSRMHAVRFTIANRPNAANVLIRLEPRSLEIPSHRRGNHQHACATGSEFCPWFQTVTRQSPTAVQWVWDSAPSA